MDSVDETRTTKEIKIKGFSLIVAFQSLKGATRKMERDFPRDGGTGHGVASN